MLKCILDDIVFECGMNFCPLFYAGHICRCIVAIQRIVYAFAVQLLENIILHDRIGSPCQYPEKARETARPNILCMLLKASTNDIVAYHIPGRQVIIDADTLPGRILDYKILNAIVGSLNID